MVTTRIITSGSKYLVARIITGALGNGKREADKKAIANKPSKPWE